MMEHDTRVREMRCRGAEAMRDLINGDAGCNGCGKTTPVMHTTIVPRRRLCDDCCPENLKRKAVSQEVVDILTKE